ncbi:hypothetical protein BL253_34000 [Pseudofrankia asymbiotica]|uniref:DUF2178 domain-containing protein n=2 Tax=Pseudofrankia asymbiotica TaxID=1834516 RepID=A0A1V2I2W6_9ACTN|nr:hypothetical protein BL253_34000 [Pseudofrankia asymbiotica]
MTHEQKRAWIRLVVAVVAYAAYVVAVAIRTDAHPLVDVRYVGPLLWSVGAAIAASIVVEIAIGVANPKASRVVDERDREIGRLGEHVAQSFVVIGAVAAMLMAMVDWDTFWIANVIYLCFVLSAILGGVAKVVLYGTGVPRW